MPAAMASIGRSSAAGDGEVLQGVWIADTGRVRRAHAGSVARVAQVRRVVERLQSPASFCIH